MNSEQLRVVNPSNISNIFKHIKPLVPGWLWEFVRGWFFRAKRILSNDYSQAGETKIILELLRDRINGKGYFVEIGANDGVTVSGSFGLVRNGWSGLSVEANPVVFERLQQNLQKYPKVKTVGVAVAPKKGTVRLYLGKDDPQGLLSTLSTEGSPWFDEHRSDQYLEVKGIPLTELLEEQDVPPNPDLMIVDAEGMDYEILQSLNFDKYCPTLIVTEDYQPKNDLKFRLLEQAGYHFSRQVGCNTFWMKSI